MPALSLRSRRPHRPQDHNFHPPVHTGLIGAPEEVTDVQGELILHAIYQVWGEAACGPVGVYFLGGLFVFANSSTQPYPMQLVLRVPVLALGDWQRPLTAFFLALNHLRLLHDVTTNSIRLWLARLQHRFSPRRVRLGSAGHTLLPGGGSDAVLCLVGRELCLFATFDASKAPQRERKAFVALAVRRTAPFTDPEFDLAWNADGTAVVWYWSRARVDALAVAVPGRRRRFVAEALHVGQVQTDAVELLSLAKGVEARVWKAGQLRASRWWPQVPTREIWQEFMRGTGLMSTATADVPECMAAAPTQTPWGRRALDADVLHLAGLEQYLPKAALAAGVLLLLAAGVQVGEIVRARWVIHQAQVAATDLDAPLARILDARQSADAATAEIAQLVALRALRPTTSLMAELTRNIPGRNWQLKQWNQPTPDTVEIRMSAPDVNPETLVAALENSSMFRGVTPEITQNNDLIVRATIMPPGSWAGVLLP